MSTATNLLKGVLLLAAAFVLGLGSYFVAGIAIASARNQGRFYSVPFGGYAVSDQALLFSLFAWIALWLVVLKMVAYLLNRKKSGQE